MILDKILMFFKRIFSINSYKQIPEASTNSNVNVDGAFFIENSASNSTDEPIHKESVEYEKDFNINELVKFDDELIELAKQYKTLKEEYLREKREIDEIDKKIENLEKQE